MRAPRWPSTTCAPTVAASASTANSAATTSTSSIDNLGDRLRIAMDSGANRVLIPTTNAADLGSVPSELLDRLRVEFISDPMQAAFKALVEA